MKKLSSLTFAAVIGSVLTLLAYKGLGMDKTVVIEESQAATPTMLTKNNLLTKTSPATPLPSAVKAMPVDFTTAAARSMPAVVHIKSTVEYAASQGQGQNPYGDMFEQFREFFGDDFDLPFPGGPNGGGGQIPRGQSSGSGVVISEDGYIVTNNHVVEGATQLEVTTFDNRTLSARLIGTDPSTDLAVIKIDNPNLPMLDMSNSDDVKVGEWVLAVGNPFDLTSTVTAGIVSAKGRNIDILKDNYAIESFIQTDAAVNPGNSGGALVDVSGNLIGINTAIATRTGYYAGYSFAVPTNIVRKVVDDLIQHGQVQRGVLGVSIRNMDTDLAKELGLKSSQGVYVNGLLEGGSAKEAGIREGDVIIGVNGATVNTAPELQEQIGRKRPGDIVDVEVIRDGRNRKVKVPLRNRNGNTEIVRNSPVADDLMNQLGVELENLSESEARRLDLQGGVKVVDIEDGVLKNNTNIQEGFIITKAADQEVRSVRELTNALTNKKSRGVMLEGVYPGDPTVYYYAFGM